MPAMVRIVCLLGFAGLLVLARGMETAAGESRVFTVPAGRRARVRSVSVPDGRGFRLIETRRGWTVYRSWGDSGAVSGLVLGPGRYKVVAEGGEPVAVDIHLE